MSSEGRRSGIVPPRKRKENWGVGRPRNFIQHGPKIRSKKNGGDAHGLKKNTSIRDPPARPQKEVIVPKGRPHDEKSQRKKFGNDKDASRIGGKVVPRKRPLGILRKPCKHRRKERRGGGKGQKQIVGTEGGVRKKEAGRRKNRGSLRGEEEVQLGKKSAKRTGKSYGGAEKSAKQANNKKSGFP